jgi:hypothetical protein
MTETPDPMVMALRQWAAEGEPAHARAALELLIKQGWLRRRDFTRACVSVSSRGADSTTWINWRNARDFTMQGPIGSTTELAILDLAVALAENRFALSSMGHIHRQWIADAVAMAVGVGEEAEVAAAVAAVVGLLEYVQSLPCSCAPSGDGQPCGRCAALGAAVAS